MYLNKTKQYYPLACNLYMKVITLHKRINTDELLAHLRSELNVLFKEQRKQTIFFDVYKKDDAVEIAQHELYEGPLFHLEVKGTQLLITRNEHYVDDVNSLTIESILNGLFEDLTDDERGVDLITEG
jgi:hypothetical protein